LDIVEPLLLVAIQCIKREYLVGETKLSHVEQIAENKRLEAEMVRDRRFLAVRG